MEKPEINRAIKPSEVRDSPSAPTKNIAPPPKPPPVKTSDTNNK